jgi:ORF6N domain
MENSKPLEEQMYFIRGSRVMLDQDLAELYGIDVTRLFSIMKEGSDWVDWKSEVFQLSPEEFEDLRSKRKDLRVRPHVFTRDGLFMFADVILFRPPDKDVVDDERLRKEAKTFIKRLDVETSA